MKHTVSILVENKPGVLARVSGLFSRRGFNIDSLAVGITENPEISRMTIVVDGDDRILEQVIKQLNKLVDVIKVSDIKPESSIDRELALIKVEAGAKERSEVMQIADIFRARIIDVGARTLVVEITGDVSKINAITDLLRRFGIKEMVRTGKVSMLRGAKAVKEE